MNRFANYCLEDRDQERALLGTCLYDHLPAPIVLMVQDYFHGGTLAKLRQCLDPSSFRSLLLLGDHEGLALAFLEKKFEAWDHDRKTALLQVAVTWMLESEFVVSRGDATVSDSFDLQQKEKDDGKFLALLDEDLRLINPTHGQSKNPFHSLTDEQREFLSVENREMTLDAFKNFRLRK